MLPLISIIIPTFNRVHVLGETLDSIIAQTYTNWECIIVDDSSSDYTAELLQFYREKEARIQYYRRPLDRPKGANTCRNYGFEVSRGEYIHWFDSDDLMVKDNLKEKVKHLLSSADYDFSICKMARFEGNFKKENFFNNTSNLRIETCLYEDYITGKISILSGTPLWKRKIFNQIDLFDEQLLQFQDLDFYSRIIYKNNRVGIINKELIYVRRYNDSISTKNGNFDLDVDSFLKVKERILKRTPLNLVIVEYIIRDILWAMRWSMAKKNYSIANQCLTLAFKYKNGLPLKLRPKLVRVAIFFKVFKSLGKGDTRLGSLLKL